MDLFSFLCICIDFPCLLLISIDQTSKTKTPNLGDTTQACTRVLGYSGPFYFPGHPPKRKGPHKSVQVPRLLRHAVSVSDSTRCIGQPRACDILYDSDFCPKGVRMKSTRWGKKRGCAFH